MGFRKRRQWTEGGRRKLWWVEGEPSETLSVEQETDLSYKELDGIP